MKVKFLVDDVYVQEKGKGEIKDVFTLNTSFKNYFTLQFNHLANLISKENPNLSDVRVISLVSEEVRKGAIYEGFKEEDAIKELMKEDANFMEIRKYTDSIEDQWIFNNNSTKELIQDYTWALFCYFTKVVI